MNTIVTAADERYFRTLCQFIYTFRRQKEYQNSAFICYDLGFLPKQVEYLNRLMKKTPRLMLRKFDFGLYPDFVQLSYKTYSFKPIIIQKVLDEVKGSVLWMDSATILRQPLHKVWAYIHAHGLYTPKGTSRLKDWTVQETLDYMSVSPSRYGKTNLAGGVCGFSHAHSDARQLVADWARYALIHECIKPKGADRSNHRDDQSLLTILVYQLQEKTGMALTQDEVNISSTHPVKAYSVMNKLPPTYPLRFNFWSVLYFEVYRRLDILACRISGK